MVTVTVPYSSTYNDLTWEAARTAVVVAALSTSHPVLHWFHTDPATASKGETTFLNYTDLEIGFK